MLLQADLVSADIVDAVNAVIDRVSAEPAFDVSGARPISRISVRDATRWSADDKSG